MREFNEGGELLLRPTVEMEMDADGQNYVVKGRPQLALVLVNLKTGAYMTAPLEKALISEDMSATNIGETLTGDEWEHLEEIDTEVKYSFVVLCPHCSGIYEEKPENIKKGNILQCSACTGRWINTFDMNASEGDEV